MTQQQQTPRHGGLTAVERIRALKLTEEEQAALASEHGVFRLGDRLAEAQYKKLLEGLVEWLAVELTTNDCNGYWVLGALQSALEEPTEPGQSE